MKRIAVTQRLENNENYYEQREMLDIRWGELFEKLNLLPILLPTEYDFKKYFKELNIDGILLTGGNDLDRLGHCELSVKRDQFEKRLIEFAVRNEIPVFGVCRGMQVIAEYFGSTFKKVNNQVSIRHRLKVNGESKYSALLANIGEVNSFHNYAVDTIATDLMISATNEENLIKAIEHKTLKIFGQMWHSERENPLNDSELSLIKSFFND